MKIKQTKNTGRSSDHASYRLSTLKLLAALVCEPPMDYFVVVILYPSDIILWNLQNHTLTSLGRVLMEILNQVV